MKKKVMYSMLTTLCFSLTIITILFITIESYQYMENMKKTLKINNEIIINVLKNEKLKIEKLFSRITF